MATLGKSKEGKEEKLTVQKSLVNDKRKIMIRLLDLCVMLTRGCLCFMIFMLLSIFNTTIMLIS